MKTLMVDVGGTNVKVMVSYDGEVRKMPSGLKFTASEMVLGVLRLTGDLEFDRVSLGFPGLVEDGKPALEPSNLGGGWVGFDYSQAFCKPVRCINDAAMQALGNYDSGRLLFLGFGTGIGATVIVDDIVVPIEVGSVKLNRVECLADRLSKAALKRDGREHWSAAAFDAIELLRSIFKPDQTVLGGGNAKYIDPFPSPCRRVDNRSAYTGAQRLWEDSDLFASACATSWRIHRDDGCRIGSKRTLSGIAEAGEQLS
jgi:polyphosphate glucokinase